MSDSQSFFTFGFPLVASGSNREVLETTALIASGQHRVALTTG
jgi:hypothetical protein